MPQHSLAPCYPQDKAQLLIWVPPTPTPPPPATCMPCPSPCPLGADSPTLCSLLPPGHLSRDSVCWMVLSAPSSCGYSLNLGCFFRVAISGHQFQEAFLALSSGLYTTHLYFSSNHSFFSFGRTLRDVEFCSSAGDGTHAPCFPLERQGNLSNHSFLFFSIKKFRGIPWRSSG